MKNRRLLLHKVTYFHFLGLIPLFLLFVSCRTQKQVQYLQGPIDTAVLSKIVIPEPTIQKGDILGITVFSDNPAASAEFNQQVSLEGRVSIMPQYLVDTDGNIQFYSLGLIKAAGLTKSQLSVLFKEKLSPYLKNPYCVIRFMNNQFTVLGEVSKQGLYSFPGEKPVTIFQALGMAGDLTNFGLKDSILVIREVEGKRSFGYLDVSNPEVIQSPYYYLQQNDVVMVRTHPKKPVVTDQTSMRTLTITATIVSMLASISLIITRL